MPVSAVSGSEKGGSITMKYKLKRGVKKPFRERVSKLQHFKMFWELKTKWQETTVF
jgi:hypothetical protein